MNKESWEEGKDAEKLMLPLKLSVPFVTAWLG